jgi:hypothetical protein
MTELVMQLRFRWAGRRRDRSSGLLLLRPLWKSWSGLKRANCHPAGSAPYVILLTLSCDMN